MDRVTAIATAAGREVEAKMAAALAAVVERGMVARTALAEAVATAELVAATVAGNRLVITIKAEAILPVTTTRTTRGGDKAREGTSK